MRVCAHMCTSKHTTHKRRTRLIHGKTKKNTPQNCHILKSIYINLALQYLTVKFFKKFFIHFFSVVKIVSFFFLYYWLRNKNTKLNTILLGLRAWGVWVLSLSGTAPKLTHTAAHKADILVFFHTIPLFPAFEFLLLRLSLAITPW